MRSPLAVGSFAFVDVSAPGAPEFLSASQNDNQTANSRWRLPSSDSDGSPLTGLTRITHLSLPMVDGINPFDGLDPESALRLTGVVVVEVVINPDAAGSIIDIEFVLPNVVSGSLIAVAAFVQDD